jgi:hypothetical protein
MLVCRHAKAPTNARLREGEPKSFLQGENLVVHHDRVISIEWEGGTSNSCIIWEHLVTEVDVNTRVKVAQKVPFVQSLPSASAAHVHRPICSIHNSDWRILVFPREEKGSFVEFMIQYFHAGLHLRRETPCRLCVVVEVEGTIVESYGVKVNVNSDALNAPLAVDLSH